MALMNVPIKMADTWYGRFLRTQKRNAEQSLQHMDTAKRDAFLQRLTEIATADVKDGQSQPSNPIPV